MPITVERRGGGTFTSRQYSWLSLFLPSHLPRNVSSGEMRIKGEMQASTWKGPVLHHGLNTGISDVTAGHSPAHPCSPPASVWLSPFLLQNGFSIMVTSSPGGCTLWCLSLWLLPSCLRFILSLGLPPPDIPKCPGVTASPLSLFCRAGTGSLGTLGVTLIQTLRLSAAHPCLAMLCLSPGVPQASRLTA